MPGSAARRTRPFSDIVGDQSILGSIQYVITLDTDTQLPRDAARTLVGNLAHPLNRPVYDAAKGRVVDGYAILQPRASISLTSAGQSRFTRLFAGDSGIDPYTREVSDVYQDVFGEGSFIGKGIYDVDAFRQAVDGRFPENLILSHDLLESGYARSALVTDVDLIEEHPASVAIESSRRHRWIRGDWQLAGWLLPRVPGPPASMAPRRSGRRIRCRPCRCGRFSTTCDAASWRRRCLPCWWGDGCWARAPCGCGPCWSWRWCSCPPCCPPLIELIRKPEERDWLVHLSLTGKSAGRPIALAFLTLAFLPYDTLIYLGAILRSGVRMPFTRRGLLLWQLPGYARRNARRSLADFFREMWIAPVLAVVLAVALAMAGSRPAAMARRCPLLLLWLVSPVVGWWISRPLAAPTPGLSVEQQAFLRTAARRTWRYFADFVGPDDNWLPPDNFQAYPAPAIASRTSPTNMGMSLLADLAAVDFGYLTVGECLQRIGNTLASMEKLERYRGHFFNWYDTRTLQPLHPQYVSSVDSGNLAGSLLTLQAGLAELKNQPVLSSSALQGLQDTLQVLAEQLPASPVPELAKKIRVLQDALRALTLEGPPQTLAAAVSALDQIHRTGGALLGWLPVDIDVDGELVYWARAFDQQFRALRDELGLLVPGSWQGSALPTRMELAGANGTGARAQLDLIDDLMNRCRVMAEMDFEFLYDAACGLLTIGYDVGERRRDPSCYDLLASEARLASFLLIAQGQVPQKHWFALGRLLTSHGGDVSLISWSGSMFEYLMPQLIMPSYANTLLEQTCKAAVSRQIEYGRQRAVPWGISESCYNATDINQVYQYRAFGVPGLGFKRGLGDDLVIAPYASALALTVMPREACRNLQTLADQGFLGAYGFYEAIDYTPTRVPRGKPHAIVRTFMAHHQGMSLLAFAHVLFDQPMQRRFMSDPLARATELLLQERVPKKGATLHPHAAEVSAAARPPSADVGSIMRVFTDPNTQLPEVHLLSNGRYHVMATHAGGSTSRWRDLAVTRWREDATSDGWGTFIYLRDRDNGKYWSTAHQPTLRRADHYEAIFVQARAEYRRRDHAIEAHTEISVSPEDDVEIRRVTLTNQSSRRRHIEVTSYAEVVLAPLNADLAHRSFSNLFVQTEILPAQQAILCTRRPRTPGEQVPWMFHLLAAPGAVADEPSFETDRARFIGRGRTAANPVVLDSGDRPSTLSNTRGLGARSHRGDPPHPDPVARRIGERADHLRRRGHARGRTGPAREILRPPLRRARVRDGLVPEPGGAAPPQRDRSRCPGLRPPGQLRHLRQCPAPRRARHHRPQPAGAVRTVALRHLGRSADRHAAHRRPQPHRPGQAGAAGARLLAHEGPGRRPGDRQRGFLGLPRGAAGPDHGADQRGTRSAGDRQTGRGLRAACRRAFRGRAGAAADGRPHRLQRHRRDPDRAGRSTRVDRAGVGPPRTRAGRRSSSRLYPLAARERIFSNGLGGFTPDGHEYVVTLEPGQTTPAPWVNVIASPHIGTVVSESGSAYTWAENAHEFRLTTWHNDPLTDASGEALYIRDEETGAFWSPTPLPARGKSGYVCRHGFGYSVFEHYEAGIASELYTYVAMDAPVKFVVVKLHNQSKRARSLSLTGYWELVLGEWRHANLMHIVTESDPQTGALFARNAYGRECAGRVVFAHVSERERSVSGNRTEFIGRNGSLASPAAMRRKRLSGRTGAGLDPCAAIQSRIELAAGQTREIVFVFGAAGNADEARAVHPALRRTGERTAGAGNGVGTLEPHAGRGERGDAGPCAQRARQRLAGLSDAVLQAVGAQRLLPVRRRLRLPRSIAGHHGAGPCHPVARPRAADPARRAPVPQGRRAALVAPAQRTGRAHPFLRRLSVAAVCRLPLCDGDRRHRRARRVHPFPRRPRAVCRKRRPTTTSRNARPKRRACTSTACAPSSTACASAPINCR